MVGLNLGSGQRRFDTSLGWVNVDCVSREGQVPDVLCDIGEEALPFETESVDCVVLHQVYEHFGLGEGMDVILEANRVLKKGGSLIVTVPDMRALCQRWLNGSIEDYIFMVNVYGAYQGEPGDRHKWGYDSQSLKRELLSICNWSSVDRVYNKIDIAGADIAFSWWILAIKCIK